MNRATSERSFGHFSYRLPAWLHICFWISMVIGVAIVFRRLFALHVSTAAAAPPDLARLDAWFRAHDVLTHAHILVALAFLCVLPFVFSQRTRSRPIVYGSFYMLGAAVALTAYGMTTYSVGGWTERAAVLVFDTLFAAELWLSFRALRHNEREQQQRWTMRATATVLGIATTRPVMGVFFATAQRTHWTPEQFFGPAFWIGFTINVAAMELWLRTRSEGTSSGRLS
jgi:hypothetical protein